MNSKQPRYPFLSRLLVQLLCVVLILGSLCGCNRNTNSTQIPTSNSSVNSQGSEITYAQKDSKEFEVFLNEIFQEELTANTLNLHYIVANPENYDINNYPISLGDLSTEALEQSTQEVQTTLTQLQEFDRKTLSLHQQLTYDILESYLSSQLKLDEYELLQEILSPNNGLQSQLPILLAEFSFNSEKDVTDYLGLLNCLPTYYSQIMDFEERKSQAGYFMSDELCNQVIASCNDFIDNCAYGFMISSFSNRIKELSLSSDKTDAYIAQNLTCIEDSVIPAYEDMIARLTALRGTSTNNKGLFYFDKGADYYELLVQSETGTQYNMDDLFTAIENSRNQQLQLCSSLYSKNPNILDACDSVTLPYTDEKEMISQLQAAMKNDFPEPVISDYNIDYVDASLSEYLSPAFYLTAQIDAYDSNTIYINDASSYNDIYYFTTLAHEGFPGHLYQTTMTYSYGFDPIRSLLNFGGFTEGWATYVEMRSFEYAGIDRDVAEFLKNNRAATLSLYATSDIGIHYYGWTYDDMYDFWSDYGITDEATIKEITGLVLAEPGNYLNYYVGYLEFEELYHNAKSTYGDNFSLRDFHEALLKIGPAPFDIVSRYLDLYYSKSIW